MAGDAGGSGLVFGVDFSDGRTVVAGIVWVEIRDHLNGVQVWGKLV